MKVCYSVTGAALLTLVASLSYGQTTEVARCGASGGMSYYPIQGAVSRDAGGWQKDGLSNGSIRLLLLTNGLFDVSHGADGGGMTARQDRAEVQVIRRTDSEIAVLAVYPLSVETYLFTLDDGKPVVVWTRSKGPSASVATASVFVAPCDHVHFNGAPKP